jgi:hypothetical protein
MWQIKSKTRTFKIRDGNGTVRVVGHDWIDFEILPRGTNPDGDGDIDVRRVGGTETPEPQKSAAADADRPRPIPRRKRHTKRG